MKYLFAPHSQAVLRQFATSKVLLAFDYDGTLAPITDLPEAAAIRSTTLGLLYRLVKAYPCVVISGRSRADMLVRVKRVKPLEVIGNHGAERWQGDKRLSRDVKRWLPILKRRLGDLNGVVIEDKALSVSVHYRQSSAKRKVLAAILDAVALLGEVRLIRGKQVVNILPNGAHHKGIALQKALVRYRCDTAIFVGDDQTDEDVFALDQPDRLLKIRVGSKHTSLADYYLRSQSEINRLLRFLLACREKNAESSRFSKSLGGNRLLS